MKTSFPLDELIDIDELQSIQDSFAKAVGLSSVILSAEGEPLTRLTNPTGFCSLIQSTEKGKEINTLLGKLGEEPGYKIVGDG